MRTLFEYRPLPYDVIADDIVKLPFTRSEPDAKLVDQRDCPAKAAFCSANRMNRQSERATATAATTLPSLRATKFEFEKRFWSRRWKTTSPRRAKHSRATHSISG